MTGHKIKAVLVLVLLTLIFSPQADAATIAKNGLSKAVIVVAHDATPPVKHAAAELADFLGQITCRKFEIVNSPSKEKTNLFVGPKAAKIADANFSTEGLGKEGLIIRNVGDDLILAGGYPRGTLYSVYSFLEDHLGCRWWTSNASLIPKKPILKVENLDVRFIPTLELRQTSYGEVLEIDWHIRNKLNGGNVRLDEAHGKSHVYAGFVHTFVDLIPPEKYFDQHPEWFSMLDGQRKATVDSNSLNPHAKLTQLCLTNDQMREELTKNLRIRLRNNPDATIASVSQNDGFKFCQCPKCHDFNEKEGSEAGTMISFVNTVAADIEAEFPDMTISTLAYVYSRKAPKTLKPRHNVSIQLCTIECSFSVPFTHDRNGKFRDDIIGWSKICDRLYIWDYTTNFRHYLAPHPNIYILGQNIKFFVENGAKGIYEQGATRHIGASMAELKSWVISKLLWDPSLDDKKLIDEFLAGYFGKADVHIKAYLDTIHDAVDKYQDELGCFADLPQSQIKVRWETPDSEKSKFNNFQTLIQGWKHLIAAEQAVKDNPDLRFRVQVAQLPVMYSFMLCWENYKNDAAKAGVDWPFSDSIEDVHSDFMKVANRKGVFRLSERIPDFYAVDEALKKFGKK